MPEPPRAFPEPALDGEPGWIAHEHFGRGEGHQSFVSGDPQGNRLRVRYFQRAADGALMAKVWFGPGAQGPPGNAHGGSMAAVLDEAMGMVAWMAGHAVVAASITIDFRNMLPLHTEAVLEAWVDRVDGNKVHSRARLSDADGKAFAEGRGLFIAIGFDEFGELGAAARDRYVDDGSAADPDEPRS